ncbi:hypothetical protein CTI12_AA039540 [Artemisia annua]|uniref:XS domain-containing protein n=1 Tax=Artemisia annua TaxID=35608 RepID=A0A2U1QEE3_ARTAN|nr:hypothetical protein CTI12_AA039540 [Artemisia annua]
MFDSLTVGYLEAERLSKHFESQGLGRDGWNLNPCLFHSEGNRQLYGYLATEKDWGDFNQCSPGKWKLLFEFASYGEKVVSDYQHLYKDSQPSRRKEDGVTRKVKLDGDN